MLIEILPFLRAIASAIQSRLGDSHPGVLPTVLAAYAMTSLLIGVIFILLGALRWGRLVSCNTIARYDNESATDKSAGCVLSAHGTDWHNW